MTAARPAVDTTRPIRTPEGAVLTLRVAGPGVRAAAWTIDLAIRGATYFAASIALGLLGGVGVSLFLLLLFAGEWFYFALFEGLVGATPGKRRMGLVVVQRDGAPCDMEASLVRNFVRFVDMLPPLYGFGLLSALASPEFQRLGDRAAGTLVVYGSRGADRRHDAALRRRRKRTEVARAIPDGIEPAAPTLALTGEEEATLLEFARRAGAWGEERQREVADRLEPLTGLTGEAGRRRVWAHALWLQGRAG